MEALNARYFSKAISNRNPLVIEMIEDYWFNFGNEILNKKTLLCDQFEKQGGEAAGENTLSLIGL